MEIKVLQPEKPLTESFKTRIYELYAQLSPHKTPVPLEELLRSDPLPILVYCEKEKHIAGIATMCTYRVLSGYKGWIEDVVVAESQRGKGIGRMLIEKLIEIGKEKGLKQILLFTEDYRKAAIHLYESLGFQHKESRIYRMHLVPPPQVF